MADCAIRGWRRPERRRARSTRCSLRAEPRSKRGSHAQVVGHDGTDRRRSISGCAAANVRAALERIAGVDPALHSVIGVDPTAIDQARRVDGSKLRGPLAGQPVLIKDNIESAGLLPTTAGSLALANNVT